jgi:hypothetical protein
MGREENDELKPIRKNSENTDEFEEDDGEWLQALPIT